MWYRIKKLHLRRFLKWFCAHVVERDRQFGYILTDSLSLTREMHSQGQFQCCSSLDFCMETKQYISVNQYMLLQGLDLPDLTTSSSLHNQCHDPIIQFFVSMISLPDSVVKRKVWYPLPGVAISVFILMQANFSPLHRQVSI